MSDLDRELPALRDEMSLMREQAGLLMFSELTEGDAFRSKAKVYLQVTGGFHKTWMLSNRWTNPLG